MLRHARDGDEALPADRAERASEIDGLYGRHGKPLESEHWGEFLAVSVDGRIVVAPTLHEALRKGFDLLGPGNIVFKVGERVVGRI